MLLCILLSRQQQPKLNFPKPSFVKQQHDFTESHAMAALFAGGRFGTLRLYCAWPVQRKMTMTGHTDQTFTKLDFSNWQKALKKFSKHKQSASHRHVAEMILSRKKDMRYDRQ